ncbi:MAG: riboflavin synthase [Ignavibacteria bacterium]
MFTGIIQDTGKVKSRIKKGDSLGLVVTPDSHSFLSDVKNGDSISINGACMTVETFTADNFEFTVINESLTKTNLGNLEVNSVVNLEKAMTLNSKLDGHIIQGHVDTKGQIQKITNRNGSHEFFIDFSNDFSDNIIYVGSITINGVSLTIADIVEENPIKTLIKIGIIPHTYKITNFNLLKENDMVNIEFDMMGKYVKRILKK